MKIQINTIPLSETETEYIALPVSEGETLGFDHKLAKDFLKTNPEFGKPYEVQLIFASGQKILLVGAGKASDTDFETIQNWAGTAVKTLISRVDRLTLFPPPAPKIDAKVALEAVVLGIEIAAHDISLDYRSKKTAIKLKNVYISVEKNDRGYFEALKYGSILAESINLVKKLGDMPANELTPTKFLKVTTKAAKENKLKITVLTETEARRKGMGAFVAVASGSDEPSYMVALEYSGNPKSKEKWGLVGKGVTFDSGGLSIKPSEAMVDMKYDMCGAATVLGVLQSIVKLGIKTNIVGIMAITENLSSGKALKARDIIKMYSGKTVEILNTDAEGRLLVADGLTWAQRNFKATKLIDVATLTGAIIVALGDSYTGLFGNNPNLIKHITYTGREVGEKFWEMPMDPLFDEMIKSEFADIINTSRGGSSPKAAGAITGAKFIQQAIEDNTPWIHLDIAGTAWDMNLKPFRGVGATGVGVKTLVELISKPSQQYA